MSEGFLEGDEGRGIYLFMAVFGLANAENGGFRKGGMDGGHFNST